ncbi:MAG: glycosyltransferase, partial [Gammaproteobacteria bacterium]|nr:glycosyltransferase [Gammaproteobacteria bacterium]
TERFDPAGADVVRMPDAPADALIIGTIGRAVRVKDQLTLVDAFGRLVAQYPGERERLRLVLVGDGPESGALKARVAELGIDDLTWLPGRLDNVERVLRGLDVFALTSLNEGISNTILEAMATGLPVVATNVGGNPELVDDGSTGFLVPVADVECLSETLGRYLSDPSLRRRQGQQARDKAVRRYSLDAMVDGYVTIYDELMQT